MTGKASKLKNSKLVKKLAEKSFKECDLDRSGEHLFLSRRPVAARCQTPLQDLVGQAGCFRGQLGRSCCTAIPA